MKDSGVSGGREAMGLKPKGLKTQDLMKERVKEDRGVDEGERGNPVAVKARGASPLISSFSLIFCRGKSRPPFRRVPVAAASPEFPPECEHLQSLAKCTLIVMSRLRK